MRRVVLAFLLVGAACGHHTGAPTPPDHGVAPPPPPVVVAAPPDAMAAPDGPPPLVQDPHALAERIVGVIEDLATATGAGDCAAIGKAVGELRARDADVLDAARKADAAGRGAEIKAALDGFRDRVRAALETITKRTEPCAKDAALERAIDDLFGT